jgi:hypothetical protein
VPISFSCTFTEELKKNSNCLVFSSGFPEEVESTHIKIKENRKQRADESDRLEADVSEYPANSERVLCLLPCHCIMLYAYLGPLLPVYLLLSCLLEFERNDYHELSFGYSTCFGPEDCAFILNEPLHACPLSKSNRLEQRRMLCNKVTPVCFPYTAAICAQRRLRSFSG